AGSLTLAVVMMAQRAMWSFHDAMSCGPNDPFRHEALAEYERRKRAVKRLALALSAAYTEVPCYGCGELTDKGRGGPEILCYECLTGASGAMSKILDKGLPGSPAGTIVPTTSADAISWRLR